MKRDENLRKWRLSRRRFLQLAGATGVASVIGAWVPNVLAGGARAKDEGDGDADRKVRQWMMIIDLRRCDGCQSQNLPPRCTEACIAGHFIPEPMEWVEVYEHELDAEAADAALFG